MGFEKTLRSISLRCIEAANAWMAEAVPELPPMENGLTVDSPPVDIVGEQLSTTEIIDGSRRFTSASCAAPVVSSVRAVSRSSQICCSGAGKVVDERRREMAQRCEADVAPCLAARALDLGPRVANRFPSKGLLS